MVFYISQLQTTIRKVLIELLLFLMETAFHTAADVGTTQATYLPTYLSKLSRSVTRWCKCNQTLISEATKQAKRAIISVRVLRDFNFWLH